MKGLMTVSLAIIHVSELYNRTDFNTRIKIQCSHLGLLISFDFQILLRMRKATHAFWIQHLVSSSVPPLLSC